MQLAPPALFPTAEHYLLPDEASIYCTTSQSNAHDTKLEVLYRWHPWFGEHVVVDRAMVRNDRAVFRCRLVKDLTVKSSEVPQWMFHHEACCLMQDREEPLVSLVALRRLTELLEQRLLQDRHFSLAQGDADESSPTAAHATESVHASPESAAMEQSSQARPSDDQDAVRDLAPPACDTTQKRKGRRR